VEMWETPGKRTAASRQKKPERRLKTGDLSEAKDHTGDLDQGSTGRRVWTVLTDAPGPAGQPIGPSLAFTSLADAGRHRWPGRL